MYKKSTRTNPTAPGIKRAKPDETPVIIIRTVTPFAVRGVFNITEVK